MTVCPMQIPTSAQTIQQHAAGTPRHPAPPRETLVSFVFEPKATRCPREEEQVTKHYIEVNFEEQTTNRQAKLFDG